MKYYEIKMYNEETNEYEPSGAYVQTLEEHYFTTEIFSVRSDLPISILVDDERIDNYKIIALKEKSLTQEEFDSMKLETMYTYNGKTLGKAKMYEDTIEEMKHTLIKPPKKEVKELDKVKKLVKKLTGPEKKDLLTKLIKESN